MKYLKVSYKQVQKNRAGIAEMWNRIPAKWVDLGEYLTNEKYDRKKLVRLCDGKDGPHNTCGAVGCFAGWNWTYHPYQQWCKRHKLIIDSTANLDIYLGLQVDGHMLWKCQQNMNIRAMTEVKHRIKALLKADTVMGEQWGRSVSDLA